MMKCILIVVLSVLLIPSLSQAECKPNDATTYALIHNELDVAFAKPGGLTTGELISLARARIIGKREISQAGRIPFRNAAYYLHGLYAATNQDLEAELWIKFFPEAYDAFKWAAHGLKDAGYPWLERFLRDNPEIPTTPPGGADWARRGLQDGAEINGSTQHLQSSEHGLNVPCKAKNMQEVLRILHGDDLSGSELHVPAVGSGSVKINRPTGTTITGPDLPTDCTGTSQRLTCVPEARN